MSETVKYVKYDSTDSEFSGDDEFSEGELDSGEESSKVVGVRTSEREKSDDEVDIDEDNKEEQSSYVDNLLKIEPAAAVIVKPVEQKASLPIHSKLNDIKNKVRRAAAYRKLKLQKRVAKKELKALKRKKDKLLGKDRPKPVPHTIESMREPDDTVITAGDEDLIIEGTLDKFSDYYVKKTKPRILLSASDGADTKTKRFMKELSLMLPNCIRFKKRKTTIKNIVASAIEKKFTDVLIVNEDRKRPTGLLCIHLPNGPTAQFRLSNIKQCQDLRKKQKKITMHRPEVILNNFKTRVGYTIGRMLGALFHYEPEFTGRRVCTFHNQRDYIFFRHHIYEFKNKEKVRIKELGPRFTMRLEWLQEGAFEGDLEWSLKRREMETSRRKFFL